jgi:putative heme-binding domain-containing protein
VWRLHPPEAVDALRRRAASSSLSELDRSQAVTALAFIQTRNAVEAMLTLMKDKNKTIAEQATYWVTFRQGNEWFALWDWSESEIDVAYERRLSSLKILRSRILDPQMPFNEKKWSANDMAKDAMGARMLLGLAAEKKLPDELYSHVETLLSGNENAAVRMQASGYFSDSRGAKDFSVNAISKLPATPSAGRSVFENNCASCHRIKNTGVEIGPDLTGIKNKFDRENLLEAIIHPDAGIVFGYEAWTIILTDGQSFFGFLLADAEKTVTIRDLAGKNHVIETSRIRSRKKQERSLMPSPAALGLSEQDLAGLAEYLMTVD